MPLLSSSTYRAPMWIGGKHAQTIIPALFRKVQGVSYIRERIETSDGDFLDLDWSCQGNKRLAIVSHGLEGATTQPYMLGMVKQLNQHQWDTLCWNLRSCSGELNRSVRLYHAGSTDDLKAVVEYARNKNYEEIVLVGFSLGGSLIIKYLGEMGTAIPRELSRAVTISVPCDLYACIKALSSGINRIYLNHFLVTLKEKMTRKTKLFPDLLKGINISGIRDLIDFDNHFTAPLNGFRDAWHYYAECSCKKGIGEIRIPSLILNAQNDPFLHPRCFPIEECRKSDHVFFESPYDGGHQGFMKKHVIGTYWSEERVIDFLSLTAK